MGVRGDGEERCSYVAPTAQTLQRKDAVWLSAIPSQPSPGTTWHGENWMALATLYVLSRGGELKASGGFCLQPSAWDQECSF